MTTRGSNTFALINIAKADLRMEDDDYRALLKRVTGKISLRVMSNRERIAVVNALKEKGFKPKQTKKPYSNKPYVRLIHALWKSVHEKGVVADGSKRAMRAFVKNITGASDPEFLTYDEASPVIEALKAMEARATKKQNGGG